MSTRLKSLVKVQLIEVWRNPTMLMLPLVVLLLTALWAMIARGTQDGFLIAASLLMAVYLVGFQIPALSIAEDKDKRTLEAVLLTPASPLEVIGAKAAVAALVSVVTAAFGLLIYREFPAHPGLALIGFALSLLLAISLGILIGVVSKDQKTAGELSAPVLILLLIGTTMPWSRISPAVWSAMRWLPTRPVIELMQGTSGVGSLPTWQSISVMLVYVALSVLVSARMIRRKASGR